MVPTLMIVLQSALSSLISFPQNIRLSLPLSQFTIPLLYHKIPGTSTYIFLLEDWLFSSMWAPLSSLSASIRHRHCKAQPTSLHFPHHFLLFGSKKPMPCHQNLGKRLVVVPLHMWNHIDIKPALMWGVNMPSVLQLWLLLVSIGKRKAEAFSVSKPSFRGYFVLGWLQLHRVLNKKKRF